MPFGFFSALPAILREQGFSLTRISLTYLLALPWALKFLWAPLVDRFGSQRFGARRSWIVPLQLAAALMMLFMSTTSIETGLSLVLTGVLFANFLAATQDIATDAMAVDLLSYKERGLGNGVQVAAYRIGMIVGGGFLIQKVYLLGWPRIYMIMAAILAVATIPILLYREPRRLPADSSESLSKAAFDFITRPGIALWLLPMMLYKAGDAMGSAQLRPLLVDIGVGTKDQAEMVGMVGYAAGLLGAMGGGYFASRFGRRRAVLVCGVFQTCAVALYLWPAQWIGSGLPLTSSQWQLLYALCAVEHFAGGTATVALFTLMMDFCKRETAATDYTLQASLVVIATIAASTVSGPIADGVGFEGLFFLSAIGSLTGVGIIWALLSRTSIGQENVATSVTVSA